MNLPASVRVQGSLPVVRILTTGGTIAGASSSATSSSYQSAAQSGLQLLESVQGLGSIARLQLHDVLAKDSANIELHDWWVLVNEVWQAVADPGIDAVVITHGTDTMEETAYFLSLTVGSSKPVVMVGAMRPATALSADGPLNLYNAVAVAVSPDSTGRGVMVAMNGRIFEARDVTKSNTVDVQAFSAPNRGHVGVVHMGQVRYLRPASRQTPVFSLPVFSQAASGWLPRVDVLFVHAAMSSPVALIPSDLVSRQGLVLAALGAGNIPSSLGDFIRAERDRGVVIVRATRVGSGPVLPDYNCLDSKFGLVCAGELPAQKARILLMLCLLQTTDPAVIQQHFLFD